MNSLVRAPVEGEALGPAKTESPVNVIVGRRVVMGGRMGRGTPIYKGKGRGWWMLARKLGRGITIEM